MSLIFQPNRFINNERGSNMQFRRTVIFLLLLVLLVPTQLVSAAAPAATVTGDQAVIKFPDTITFQAQIANSVNVTSVTLEYGDHELTCGTVIAKAFPQFQPGQNVSVSWTWDMHQSGSLPPGETVWWRWHIVDANGQETVTDQKTIIWLDSVHKWQTITNGDLRLHWYSGSQSFAQSLLTDASQGLQRLETNAGLTLNSPVDFYIYASTNDMKDAIFYEPSWTGGEAFPSNDIVILGISTSDLDWGSHSIVHELTHVLVGHLTFSCLSSVPTWLDEGLAVYSEGPLASASQQQLDSAIQDNSLLSIRSLSGGFSEVADKANLSYSESDSIVNYLIGTYGQSKMNNLLIALRDGATIDEALQKTYGFDVDGLEQEWRKAIGAPPMAASAQPTAVYTPTFVPTIVPVGGAPLAGTPTPFAIPTSSFSAPAPSTSGSPTRSQFFAVTLVLLTLCCILILIIAVVVIGLIVRSQNRKKGGSQ